MTEVPILQSKRLTLRPFTIGDFKDLNEWLSLIEVRRYLNMDDGSKDAIYDWLNARLIHNENMGISSMSWAITPMGSYKVIGNIELWATGIGSPTAEIGFALNPAYQHQGLMTEALHILLDYCFIHWSLPRIQAVIVVDNLASIKLIERLGFVREGRLRAQVQTQYYQGDSYIYSILPHEWKKLNNQ
ncbi:MAG: GNAT family N-acetyltransferase [Alphaproteobacteria bacterium]